jgi:hypothetical protein
MSFSLSLPSFKGTTASSASLVNTTGPASTTANWKNPRMRALIEEIARFGSLSEESLNSVLANPSQYTQDEFRRLISAIEASAHLTEQRPASGLSAGGAILNFA